MLRVVSYLGHAMPYAPMLQLQERLVGARRAGAVPDTLLLLEVCARRAGVLPAQASRCLQGQPVSHHAAALGSAVHAAWRMLFTTSPYAGLAALLGPCNKPLCAGLCDTPHIYHPTSAATPPSCISPSPLTCPCLTQHAPTYTVGKRGSASDFLIPPEALAARGAETVTIPRGGETTWHGPGQLVAYPIIDLRAAGLGARRCVFLGEGCCLWGARGVSG